MVDIGYDNRNTWTESVSEFLLPYSHSKACKPQCTENENKCKLCCEKVVDGKTQCLVSNDTVFAGTDLATAISGQAPYLLPG